MKSGPIGDDFANDQKDRNNLLNDYDFVEDYDYLTGFDTQGKDIRSIGLYLKMIKGMRFPDGYLARIPQRTVRDGAFHLIDLLNLSGDSCYRAPKIKILRFKSFHQ